MVNDFLRQSVLKVVGSPPMPTVNLPMQRKSHAVLGGGRCLYGQRDSFTPSPYGRNIYGSSGLVNGTNGGWFIVGRSN